MAGRAGTLETLARHVALALAPLEAKMASGNVAGLFSELGLQFPPELLQPALVAALEDAASASAALPAAVAQLTTSIENEAEAGIVQAGVAVVERVVAVTAALESVGTQLGLLAGSIPGVPAAEVSAFASELPGRLVGYALITYLEQHLPALVAVANLAGVIDHIAHDAGPDAAHPAYIERRLQPSRLSGLLSSPQGTFAAAYGWGQPGFDGTALLARLSSSLALLGLNAPPDGAGTSLTSPALEVHAAPPGITATLHQALGDALDLTVPITPTWSVHLLVQGTFGAELVATATPPASVSVKPPSGTLAGAVGFDLIAHGADAAHPFVLAGQTGGSVIRAGALTLKVGATLTWDVAKAAAALEPVLSLAITDGRAVIDLSGADGFISSVAGGGGALTANVGFQLRWSPSKGASIEGSSAIDIGIPTHVSLGPLEIDTLYLKLGLGPGGSLPAELSSAFKVGLGPLEATVDRIGLTATTTFPAQGATSARPTWPSRSSRPTGSASRSTRASSRAAASCTSTSIAASTPARSSSSSARP